MTLKINTKVEYSSKRAQRELQFKLLKKALNQAYKSKFYKIKFKQAGVTPKNFKRLEDIQKFPLTSKKEFIEHNMDFLACTPEKVIRLIMTGGTTGKPKMLLLSKKDIESYSIPMIRNFIMANLTQKDVAILLINVGLTSGGIMYGIEAPERFEMLPLQVGLMTDPKTTCELMRRLHATTFLAAAPSMIKFTHEVQRLGFNLKKDFSIRHIISGGAGVSPQMRKSLEKIWGAKWYHAYGSCEGGRMSAECKEHDGYHTFPDDLYVETLSPKTGIPVADGEEGVMTFTTLKREAMPLIRYQGLNDVVRMSTKKCACGRTTPRLWVTGRLEERIVLKGFYKLYLYQIDEAFKRFQGINDYQLVIIDKGDKDYITVQVELEKRKRNEKLKQDLQKAILFSCESLARGIKDKAVGEIKVEFVNIGLLPRSSQGKLKTRLLDKRKLKFIT